MGMITRSSYLSLPYAGQVENQSFRELDPNLERFMEVPPGMEFAYCFIRRNDSQAELTMDFLAVVYRNPFTVHGSGIRAC